jgi:hypothetical protein
MDPCQAVQRAIKTCVHSAIALSSATLLESFIPAFPACFPNTGLCTTKDGPVLLMDMIQHDSTEALTDQRKLTRSAGIVQLFRVYPSCRPENRLPKQAPVLTVHQVFFSIQWT